VYGIAAFSTCETFAEAFGWGYHERRSTVVVERT